MRKRAFVFLFFILSCELIMARAGDTTVCETRGNKGAAVTFTTDDGLLKSVRYYVSIWKELGLRGTCALAAGNPGDWRDWIELMETGCLDIGNHSMGHPRGGLVKCSWQELEGEVNGAQETLDENLGGFKTVCFLCPEGAYNDQVVKKIEERHIANRVVDRGYNSFDPTRHEIYRLKRQQILAATPLEEMNGWIDKAISDGTWLIEAYHGCGDEGWQPPPCERLKQHYQYVASRLDDIWCGTFQEVITYIKERNAAQVKVLARQEARMIISLEDSLDDSVYSTPLTLKTQVFSSWQKVKIVQDGESQTVKAVSEDGKPYIYYDAAPHKGKITLVPERK